MDVYIHIFSHFHAVDSHSFTFPFPSLSFIPILMGFALGYSHSHPISKHTRSKAIKYKYKQSTDEQQKRTVSQKNGHQSLKNKNSKNTIQNTLKIRQNLFPFPLGIPFP